MAQFSMDKAFDIDNTITTITRFINRKLVESGLDGFVIGLSGGIDSAVSSTLAVKAVGPEKVLGVMMPYKTSSENSLTDAMALIKQLGIESRKVEISPMIDAYFKSITESNRMRAGNKMARERMSILFDIASETGRMVLGTGNRTEICLGYTTWYGDSACSINPVGELYKSEIWALGMALSVPDSIIKKSPTADLWPGQTDEGELGLRYQTIDSLFMQFLENGVTSMTKLKSLGFNEIEISRVISLMNMNAYKRQLPEIPPLGKNPIPRHVQLED